MPEPPHPGRGPWPSDEVAAICKIVGIPQEQIGYYFFPDVEPEGKKGGIRMRIKSGVFYWLAVASGAVGMLYALGFAGSIEALGVISDTDFITAMVLLLLALFFAQLGDHAAEREKQHIGLAVTEDREENARRGA